MFSALALGIVSCSDKPDDPEKPDKPSGEMEVMTPSESKKYLAEQANEFLGKFKAADQKEIIDLAAYCIEAYGDLDLPKEFEIDETKTEANPIRMIRAFASTVGEGNVSRAGASSITYTYSLDFEKFKGIYKPGGNRWTKSGESNDIIFQFTDAYGNNCELKAEISSKTSDGTISYVDEYYDWYYDEELSEEYVYNFRIPKEINITLKQNSNTLASSKVSSDIDVKGHKLNVTANVNAANVAAAVNLNGTDTKVSQTSSLSVSNQVLVTSEANVYGHNLCNYDFYIESEDDDIQDVLVSLLDNADATISIMNKVRIDAKATYSNALYNALNTPYDSYEFDSEADAIKAVTNALATLNNNTEALVRYDNKETVQARLTWDYDLDRYGSYWEYYINPLIQFEADQTKYGFEEYFEKGFSSVEDSWDDLVSSYRKVWNAAKRP